MRARTADGHTLQLPDARLGALLPQLHRSGLDHLVRRNYDGDLSRAVARSVGQLANRAQRVGVLRSQRTGGRYPVFSSALGGRSFQIVTRPGLGGAGTIVGIRSQSPVAEDSAEYMAAGATTLGPRRALTAMAADATLSGVRGIYQIYRDGRLIYIGESGDLRSRLQKRLLNLTQMAVSPVGYQAAVGRMPRSTERTRKIEEDRRIDQNKARPGNHLTNQREFEMMMGPSPGEGEAMSGLFTRVRNFFGGGGGRTSGRRSSNPPPPPSDRSSLAPVVIESDEARRGQAARDTIARLMPEVARLRKQGSPVPPHLIEQLRFAADEARALSLNIDLRLVYATING